MDWIWWVYMAAEASIAWIAAERKKDPAKVEWLIDGIFSGAERTTIEDIEVMHLNRYKWTPRQDEILLRLREAGCSPVRAARLLSRDLHLVKQRMKQITNG